MFERGAPIEVKITKPTRGETGYKVTVKTWRSGMRVSVVGEGETLAEANRHAMDHLHREAVRIDGELAQRAAQMKLNFPE